MCWGRVEWLNLLEVGSRCARQEEKVSLHSNMGQSADIILFCPTQVRSLPHYVTDVTYFTDVTLACEDGRVAMSLSKL